MRDCRKLFVAVELAEHFTPTLLAGSHSAKSNIKVVDEY